MMDAALPQTLSAPAFEAIAQFLKARSGLVVGPDKLYLLEARLTPLLRLYLLPDLHALSDRLRANPPETLAHAVTEAMTTNESFFFRDEKPFTHFTQNLPRLLAARPDAGPVRIWSAAASSGQEGYSLAMIIAEQRAILNGRQVEIIGTDIAREQLSRARAGLYSQFEVQRGLPIRLLMKYFRKEEAQWRIVPELRAMLDLREWNLLADLRPLGMFDVVFCRNVLIYFDQPTKARVLDAITKQMLPHAVLHLGGAETVLGLTNRLVAVTGERGVYRLAGA